MTAEKAQDAAEKTQVQLHDFLSRFGQFTIAYSEAIPGPPSTQRIGVELVQKPSFLQEQLDDLIYSEEYFDCDVEIFLRGFR